MTLPPDADAARQTRGDPAAVPSPRGELDALVSALHALAEQHPAAVRRLATALTVIVEEAEANPRFGSRLARALDTSLPPGRDAPAGAVGALRRTARRPPGPWDPHTVHADGGEQHLRDRLATLDLEQLRNIVAEHGMDSDRLAMKWRDPQRVRERIVERVLDRAVKGDEFRTSGRPDAT